MIKQQTGYVTILGVLIVGAVTLAVAVSMLGASSNSQRSILVTQQSLQARTLTGSCIEEALQLMHDTTSYTGTGSLTLAQGSCTYTVVSTGANTRTVDASSTVGSSTRRMRAYATILSTSISITSWTDVQ